MSNDSMYIGNGCPPEKRSTSRSPRRAATVRVWRFGTIAATEGRVDRMLDKLLEHRRPLRLSTRPVRRLCFIVTSKQPPQDSTVVVAGGGAKKSSDRVKTDRRDADKWPLTSLTGSCARSTCPNRRDEAMRDLVRAREDAVEARRREPST